MKRLIFITFLLLLIIFIGFFWWTVENKPTFENGKSHYQDLKQKAYSIISTERFSANAFNDFIKQFSKFKLRDWPRNFWYSLTFADPKGKIVDFQDVMMAIAMGYDKLLKFYEYESTITAEKAINSILLKRSFIWHDFWWENIYVRERAAQASLTKFTNQDRFLKHQKKLRESLKRIFLPDGSSTEGTGYGLYTINILAPYVYLTQDEEVKSYIQKFNGWLNKIASPNGFLPPFDDSKIAKLTPSLSDFKEVNRSFRDIWQINPSQENYFGINESVIKKENYTLWLRHKQKLSGKTYHQHFSQGDIILKSKDNWWLAPAGYDGSNKYNKPYLHNLAMVNNWQNNFYWRMGSIFGNSYKTSFEKIAEDNFNLILPDGIIRTVELTSNSLKVIDQHQEGEFNVYWHILGYIMDIKESENKLELVFNQGNEKFTVILSGFNELKKYKAQNSLFNDSDLNEHVFLHLKGSNIESQFILE